MLSLMESDRVRSIELGRNGNGRGGVVGVLLS